jgi:hypothetical protein
MYSPAMSLAEGLKKGWSMYTKKREWLYRLSIANESKIREWYAMDKRPVIDKHGEVMSVFRNSSTKGQSKHLSHLSFLIFDAQVSRSSQFISVC